MITYNKLVDKSQTGAAMRRMVNRFSGDLNNFQVNNLPLSKMPLQTFYEMVKRLPYKKDTDGVEIITRPLHLLTSPFKGYDCKKKAVLLAAWLKQNNIPFEFIAVSSRQDKKVHHVLIRALINGSWVSIDPTYQENILFQEKPWTAAETLSGINAGSAPVLVELYGNNKDVYSTIREYFYYGNQNIKPVYIGDGGVSAVLTIVAAIITAVAGTTAVIVNAVSNKRQQERQAAAEKEKMTFQIQAMEIDQTAKEKETSIMNNYLIYGGGALAALYFLT